MNLAYVAEQIASAFVPAPNGAHSRIAEADTVQQLLEAIDAGNYLETAAELAGLSKVTVYAWLKRADAGEEPYITLRNAIERARARAEAEHLQNIRAAGKHVQQWTASAWYLERTKPDRYGRRNDDNNAPKVIVQIGVKDSDVQVYAVAPALPASPVSMSLPEPIQPVPVTSDTTSLRVSFASDKEPFCNPENEGRVDGARSAERLQPPQAGLSPRRGSVRKQGGKGKKS